MFHAPERFRVVSHGSAADGNNGLFFLRSPIGDRQLRVICSDGMGWEHVSVSLPRSAPTWEEMCLVKDLFWDAEDAVMQLHPPRSAYVNHHPFCLHLWRPTSEGIPQPPYWMVGPKIGQSEAEARAEADAAVRAYRVKASSDPERAALLLKSYEALPEGGTMAMNPTDAELLRQVLA